MSGHTPTGWYLRTGHGDSIHFGPEPPQCLMRDAWKPFYKATPLIDAAPELLSAVRVLADDLEDGHWASTKAHLRALIAKATQP